MAAAKELGNEIRADEPAAPVTRILIFSATTPHGHPSPEVHGEKACRRGSRVLATGTITPRRIQPPSRSGSSTTGSAVTACTASLVPRAGARCPFDSRSVPRLVGHWPGVARRRASGCEEYPSRPNRTGTRIGHYGHPPVCSEQCRSADRSRCDTSLDRAPCRIPRSSHMATTTTSGSGHTCADACAVRVGTARASPVPLRL